MLLKTRKNWMKLKNSCIDLDNWYKRTRKIDEDRCQHSWCASFFKPLWVPNPQRERQSGFSDSLCKLFSTSVWNTERMKVSQLNNWYFILRWSNRVTCHPPNQDSNQHRGSISCIWWSDGHMSGSGGSISCQPKTIPGWRRIIHQCCCQPDRLCKLSRKVMIYQLKDFVTGDTSHLQHW